MAFTRRDRKQDDGSAPSATADSGSQSTSGDSKRTFEWVLEDWAVRDGVQSTTRYRKGNPSRRTAKSTSHPNGGVGRRSINQQQQQQHSSIRAMNGRKGGWAASLSRASKRGHHNHHGRLQYALMQHGFGSPSRSSMVNPNFSAAVIPISRLEPASTQTPITHVHDDRMDFSPETASPFGLHMDGGPRLDQGLAGTNAGPSGIHPVSVVGQAPMYLTPSPMDDYPFGIADVQLNYSSDARDAEISESARLFDNLHGTVGDWNHHHGL
ncbi:hypothetical protein PT974_05993 [Cladobotryum mycophilum]|uniref:Uncharacterized protein n=1 Tax=Cladobotryum mycophilum TaxID=491253 RepID=A0ABR0SKA9_9HYPO